MGRPSGFPRSTGPPGHYSVNPDGSYAGQYQVRPEQNPQSSYGRSHGYRAQISGGSAVPPPQQQRPGYGMPPPPPAAQGYPSHAPIPHYRNQNDKQLRQMLEVELRNGVGCTCKKSKCLKLYCQCFSQSTTCGARCRCNACHNTLSHAVSIQNARRVILSRNPQAFESKFASEQVPDPNWAQQQQPLPPPPYAASQAVYAAPIAVTHHPQQMSYPPLIQAPSAESAASGSPGLAHGAGGPSPRMNKKGCKCLKSFCLKKYCECYNHGAYCSIACRCTDCRNYDHGPNGPRVPPAAATAKAAAVAPIQPNGKKKEHTDDIDAAVTMTQLLSRISPDAASTDGTKATGPDTNKAVDDDGNKKRKAVEDGDALAESKKPKARGATDPKAPTPTDRIEEQEVRAVVSSSSHSPGNSRQPSPVGMMPRTAGGQFPPQMHAAAAAPTFHRPYYHPNAYAGGRAPLPSQYQQLPPHYSAPEPHARLTANVQRKSSAAVPSHNTYEETTRSSGLPKSLSFRKICSQCGKTRGEHGELGFGNKCLFKDCGRCGAGEQVHRKWNVPMGIWCTLTEKEGAIPGAAEAYNRKLQDLAVRAELQKLQQQQNLKNAVSAGE